ncbi:hypothetical protein ECG_02565 [Echinococcus granulosus]|uniref:Expressed conserved protein n=1 Tax=Echinococcus granulosus TaxID=6210 RepID=A0A068WN62_ECHGR|nr:hypothetical protein ECG_02565 [Echinococcus granulosus]CDS21563.1 expressed conserved protein [Echinococcus granulosus]
MLLYPKSELFVARNAFARRWRSAIDASSWYKDGYIESIRRVDSLHRNHPPYIQIRNADSYPFLDADTFVPPVHFFTSSLRPKKASKAYQLPDPYGMDTSQVDQPAVQVGSEVKSVDRKRRLKSPPPSLPAKSKQVRLKKGMNVPAVGNVCHFGECNNSVEMDSKGIDISPLAESGHLSRSQPHVNQKRKACE